MQVAPHPRKLHWHSHYLVLLSISCHLPHRTYNCYIAIGWLDEECSVQLHHFHFLRPLFICCSGILLSHLVADERCLGRLHRHELGLVVWVSLSVAIVTKATIKLFPKNLHSRSTPVPHWHSFRSIVAAMVGSWSNYYYNKEIHSLRFAALVLVATLSVWTNDPLGDLPTSVLKAKDGIQRWNTPSMGGCGWIQAAWKTAEMGCCS